MKKYLALAIGFSLFLSSCSIDWKDENKEKIENLEKQVSELKKEDVNGNFLDKEIKINKPISSEISKRGHYSLDCKTKYFTNTVIEGLVIQKSYIKTSKGHEKEILYIDNQTAKFFGADFNIIQDDEGYLIINRNYQPSGLTETVTINKNSGIGFDVKTLGFGLSGAPVSDTYILSCSEI